MDCRTARLLLDLTVSTVHELDGEENQALEHHLGLCAECSGAARSERQYHQRVGLAMRQIEAPPSLRNSLLTRLQKERTDYYRRQLARGTRIAVGLAACLAVSFLFWYVWGSRKPAFDVQALHQDHLEAQIFNPTPQKVNEFLAAHHVAAPGEFNYRYLVHYGMIECQGQQVPFLHFVVPEQNLSARVYIVTDKQFDPASIQNQPRSGSGGYSSEVWRPDRANYSYVIVYTGEDLKPFLVSEDRPAT